MAAYPEPDTYFAPDLAPLVAPLEGADGPAGPSLRYDPVFAKIREARTEEDATLPMGEWTRPLKKADWRAAEALCAAVLTGRSKDLQVAAWLAEAWLHRHGARGLLAGTQLLLALSDAFWDEVHPRIDDGDADTRTAPLVWASETLAQALLLHLPLLPWPDTVPPYIRLADWQRAMTAEFGGGSQRAEAHPVASRADILEQAARDPWTLVALDEALIETQSVWQALTDTLDERLGADSPSLSKTADMLGQLRLAVRSLLGDRDPRDAVAAVEEAEYEPEAFEASPLTGDTPDVPMSDTSSSPAAALPSIDSPIGSRHDAYRLLERVAEYLQRTEPHSPTPYLIRRAVTWGRLPLPELMQEVLREEGDLNRYFSMLGLRQE